MYSNQRLLRSWSLVVHAIVLSIALQAVHARSAVGQESVQFQVSEPSQRLEMIVKTSRILTMDEEVPRVMVQNPEVVKVTPLSPTQVSVSALRPGVTQVNLFDKLGNARTVDIVVIADAQQLQVVLQSVFPKAAIKVRPLRTGILLEGFVDRPETVDGIIAVAQDYYPKIISNIRVGGAQQVQLHVKVMEVSRSKLRQAGFDWGNLSGGGDFVFTTAAGLISAASSSSSIVGTGADTVRFGIVDGTNQFFGFIQFLKTHNIAKILAEPTLVAVSGRPAFFHEGGEFPIITTGGINGPSVQFKQFGTRVDFVPLVLGNGNIRLEVRPQISERDEAGGVNLNGFTIPAVRVRQVETAVEMRAGQTLALAGLIQTRSEAVSRGIPWLRQMPWAGNLFGSVRDTTDEVELLIVVRPELVGPLDPHQVPATGPGQHTTSPSDVDFFGRGYLEVPNCCPKPTCDEGYGGAPSGSCGPGGCGVPQAAAYPTPAGMTYPVSAPMGAAPVIPGGAYSGGSPVIHSPIESSGGTYEPGILNSAGSQPSSPTYPQDSYNSSNPVHQTQTGPYSTQPQLLGPSGYDELNY
ncbi:MAG: pilus assembly protein N-terminal domain-containing protein [Planctomycetales bacterium]|nr:pilus assembly protein N-terminal domain-containing protein [Planctomycetales bacterium]